MKKPLLIIAGPTAVGKTAVSVALAKRLGGECISADSIQVYRGLDIGSAKATVDEMEGVAHHLIDVMEPSEPYDVVLFREMAERAAEKIYQKKHLPILTGGTGFYIQAMLYAIDFREEDTEKEERIRQSLEEKAREPGGPMALYEELSRLDPDSALAIHPHNLRRLIRALAFYHLHQFPISAHNEAERRKKPRFDQQFFVLFDKRELLYERIDKRVDRMIAEGLLDEAEKLWKLGLPERFPSMQGIGYKELMDYFNGKKTLEESIALIKQKSRNYAKRQLTWFRREPSAIWVNISDYQYDKERIAEWIQQKCMNHWESEGMSLDSAKQCWTGFPDDSKE